MLLCNHGPIVKFRKFNVDTILESNIQFIVTFHLFLLYFVSFTSCVLPLSSYARAYKRCYAILKNGFFYHCAMSLFCLWVFLGLKSAYEIHIPLASYYFICVGMIYFSPYLYLSSISVFIFKAPCRQQHQIVFWNLILLISQLYWDHWWLNWWLLHLD